jgi:hypothetical protein
LFFVAVEIFDGNFDALGKVQDRDVMVAILRRFKRAFFSEIRIFRKSSL